MKTRLTQCFLAASITFSLFLLGCSKSGANAQTGLDPAKIPDTVNRVFASAPDETKQAASSYVAAFQSQDTATAFSKLQQMSHQPDLTPEQRQVVAKAMQTTFIKLQAAAQNGDAPAQAAMHSYLSTR